MNEVSKAKAELIEKLLKLEAPSLGARATSDELGALGDHLGDVARAVDAYINALGSALESATVSNVDMAMFINVVADAIDGNATYEIECAINDATDDEAEVANERRRRRTYSTGGEHARI